MRKICIIGAVIILILTSCKSAQRQKLVSTEQKPEKLVVYTMADKINGKEADYYCTNYTVGPFGPVVDAGGEKGYLYYETFQDFEKKTEIAVEVHYFSYMDEIEAQILADRKAGNLPDILIMDQRLWADFGKGNNIYRIFNDDWFYDLKPYAEQDELYTNGDYYEQVLEAGMYQNEQLILPLSFNIKAVFTSKQTMEDTGVYLYPEMNGREILMQLEEACSRAEKGEVAIDILSIWSSASMMIPVFWESTGLAPVDYEKKTVTLDRELFEEMAAFIKTYFKQDMEENWDEIVKNASSYLNAQYWGIMDMPDWNASLDSQKDSPAIHQKEEAERWLENGDFYIEGNSNSMHRHGLSGQCMALDTMYDQRQEEMQMIGIPMYEENDAYIAEVQMLGGVMKESKSPYYAYELLKFILDHDYTPYYSVSVSKKVTSDMLDELEKMTYTLYLALGNFWHEDVDLSKEREEYQYTLNPLKKERREQIDDLLDHIAGAVLPQCSIYEPISWHLQAYALEYETMEEAYEGACQDLEERLLFTVGEE